MALLLDCWIGKLQQILAMQLNHFELVILEKKSLLVKSVVLFIHEAS